jgi:hypothetical protein
MRPEVMVDGVKKRVFLDVKNPENKKNIGLAFSKIENLFSSSFFKEQAERLNFPKPNENQFNTDNEYFKDVGNKLYSLEKELFVGAALSSIDQVKSFYIKCCKERNVDINEFIDNSPSGLASSGGEVSMVNKNNITITIK